MLSFSLFSVPLVFSHAAHKPSNRSLIPGAATMNFFRIALRVKAAWAAGPVVRVAAFASIAAVLAFAPAAHAVPTKSLAANVVVPMNDVRGVNINVALGRTATDQVVDGWDLNPFVPTGGAMQFNDTDYNGTALVGTDPYSMAPLVQGTTIGPASTFTSNYIVFTDGVLVPNATTYFGFKFISEDSLVHYGWGTILAGNFISVPNKIGELWFESDAGVAIKYGSAAPPPVVGGPPVSVPEPATWALMLGGLAAAGGLARRRLQNRA
jgi:hypothetical protein